MPPIPSTPQDLHPAIARRLADIEEYQLPRLARCRGPAGLQRELADETRGDLEQIRRNVEMCRELGEGMRAKDKDQNATICHAFEERQKRLHAQYRRAILEAKANMVSSSRHLLHEKGTETQDEFELSIPSRPANASMAEDALQTRTNEVTDALRRTTATMQAELERSVLSVQMLEDSTRTLRSTANLYDTYTALLETSGNLIKQLEKADWWDRLVILAAFLFFLLCVGWVIKRRVLDRVIGGVGWWVGGSFKLIGMGLGIGRIGGSRQVGAGKVGRTPQGMGRVGLAGGEGNSGGIPHDKLPDHAETVPNPIMDSVVPPGETGDSAARISVKEEL